MSRRLALIPAAGLVVLAGFAFTLAVSDRYYQDGAAILDAWTEMGDEDTDGEKDLDTSEALPDWIAKQAQELLTNAQRLDPWDPDILNDLGRVHELRVSEETAHEPDSIASLNYALDYYRSSLRKRPAWPYVWSNIIAAKFKLEQLDKEFALAMERVAILAPWDWDVQLLIADGGLAYWDKLPANLQAIVTATIRRGLLTQPSEFTAFAEQMGLVEQSEAQSGQKSASPPIGRTPLSILSP
jgi:hypothetical protein